MTTVEETVRNDVTVPSDVPVLRSHINAVAAAYELASAWAKTGPPRDRDRTVPREELALLGRSGLLGIMVPERFGGPGAKAATLTRVFAILSAADAALAQVPQNHYGGVFGLDIERDDDNKAYLLHRVLLGDRFGNAGAERRKGPRGSPQTTLVPDGDGFRINGLKHFCTGALTAQWVPVSATDPAGKVATAFVPQGTDGMSIKEDWDAFGQRATVSGSAEFTDAWVSARFVFGQQSRSKASTGFRYARSQLTHAAIQLGIAEGTAEQAARLDISTVPVAAGERFRSWREDLCVEIEAATVLIERAASVIDQIVAAGDASDESALQLGIAVDEAKCIAYELGPWATDSFISFLGVDQVDSVTDIDRLWRNARTHSLHDPVRWRRHYVGDFHLNGTPPPFLKWLLDSRGDAPL